eukprot:TRINITY_DN2230_c0_g1_i1.p1 TRINITY_DN2230_c0_g1~~TRINITY_DN2230_c0_g1_i1.p1  ORF type:complete len:778 (+),score=156.39 TRINITY_DN2230_c0_g1_i1:105-2336(+)
MDSLIVAVHSGSDTRRYKVLLKNSLRGVTGAKVKRFMTAHIGSVAAGMTLRFRGREIADAALCEEAGVKSGDALQLLGHTDDSAGVGSMRSRVSFQEEDVPPHTDDRSVLSDRPQAELEAALLDEQKSNFEQERLRRETEYERALVELEGEKERQVKQRLRIEQDLRRGQEMLQKLDHASGTAAQERAKLEELRQEDMRRIRGRQEELADRQRQLEEERARQRHLELCKVELQRRHQLIEQQKLEARLEHEQAERERKDWEEKVAQQEKEVLEREAKLSREKAEWARRERELEREKVQLQQQRRVQSERFGREYELDLRRLRELQGEVVIEEDDEHSEPHVPQQQQDHRHSHPLARDPMMQQQQHKFGTVHASGDPQAARLRRAVSEAWSSPAAPPMDRPVSPQMHPGQLSPPPPVQQASANRPHTPPVQQQLQQGDCQSIAEANLADFGASLGQTLQFDAWNTCVLEIETKYTVLISFDRETERLYLYSALLTNVPTDPQTRLLLYEALLEGALLGRDMAGGGVGLSLKNDFILLGTSLPLRACGPHGLRITVPPFVEALRRWRRKVRELLTGSSQPSQSPMTATETDVQSDVRDGVASPTAPAPPLPPADSDESCAVIGVEVTDGLSIDGGGSGLPGTGVTVVRVKGAAQRAGIQESDVIASVNGQRVRTLQDFQTVSRSLAPHIPAHFLVHRAGRGVPIVVRPQKGRRRAEPRRYTIDAPMLGHPSLVPQATPFAAPPAP